MSDDFYIGYETPVPRGARSLVFAVIGSLLFVAAVLAAIIVASQQAFAIASFAFGTRTPFTGVVRLDPYPVLDTGAERLYLVAPGKHGASDLARAFEGRMVQIEGAVIARGRHRMIEIAPGGIAPGPTAIRPATDESVVDLGEATLVGEIVDGKCFLGVMNPGEGAVHRDCARACLLGGLPAMFRVHADDGRLVLFELATRAGEPMSRAVARFSGVPVSITGRVTFRQPSDTWRLVTDETSIRAR